MFTALDYQFMARALQLAKKPLQAPHPNPRVGSVIVQDQQIVGEGFHPKAGLPHAEVFALLQAGDRAKGSTVYVTLEPCSHTGRTPPCANALIEANVQRVVIAAQDPNPKVAGSGIALLQQAGIQVEEGLLETQARELNKGFIKRMQSGLPWLRCKLAMSVDGRTAMANGESQWITGPHARRDVQHWRANVDAILSSRGTVAADNPKLTVRDLEVEELRQPLRVIVDSQLRTAEDAQLFSQPGKVLLACIDDTCAAVYGGKAEVVKLPASHDRVDLSALLHLLGSREINEVHTEAGAQLNGALLEAGLVDEMVIYVAPTLMGHKARPLFHLENIHSMMDRYLLECTDIRHIGNDLRFIYQRK